MKYTSPSYEKEVIATADIICSSPEVSVYKNDNGDDTVRAGFDFSSISGNNNNY